jgi:uncharacterized protein (TIGR02145 family)
MKKIFLLVSLLFAINTVFAQTLYTRKATISITQDSVTLSAGQFRGKLQWQRSLDGKTWNDLNGKTTPTVKVAQIDDGYYRAKILEATCNPVYSDTAIVVAKKAVNNLVTDPGSISGITLVDRDNDIFTYVTSGTATQTVSIPIATVLVDNEKESDIRVVTGTIQKGDTLKVTTQPGTMEDLFVNQEFKLSTAIMTPVNKSAFLTTTALAKAMKDGSGVIHPVEIIDNNASANNLKSAQASDGTLPGIYIRKDFSGETIWKEGGATIAFDQAYYQLGAELNYEFKFEQQGFDWKNLQFPKGKLTKFKICTDKDASGIEAKMIVKATTSHDFKKDTTTSVIRKDVFNKTFKYLVFVAPSPVPIPFWATVKVDLMRRSYLNITGEASVSGGATGNFNLELGASYENGTWTTIKPALTPKFTLEGPDVDAKVNVQVKVEVYPHVEVAFYSTLAPYLDIAPYLREEMEYSIKNNFKFDLYSGVDARVGIKADVLGKSIFDFPSKDLKLAEKKLYTAPKKIEIISGNNQTTTAGKTLPKPIVVRVLDTKNNPVKNALVNFKSAFGKLIKAVSGTKSASLATAGSDELAVSADSTGQASVNWAIADTTATQKLEAYLKNGKDSIIEGTRDTITAKACNCDERYGHFTDPRDGHVYKTIEIGTQIWMSENLAYLPQVHSVDDWSISEPRYYCGNSHFGVAYNFVAASKSCPAGWHLPNDDEWNVLFNYLGGVNIAGVKMCKETFAKELISGNNISCFSIDKGLFVVYDYSFRTQCNNGIPTIMNIDHIKAVVWNNFENETTYAAGVYWSATLFERNCNMEGICWQINNHIARNIAANFFGYQVRCVKD